MTLPKCLLLILCTVWALAPGAVQAMDYFVSSSGDDLAVGTSPRTAWKSISRVNSNSYHSGDRILFQGSAGFQGNLRLNRESAGATNAPVVITSFGTGRATLLAGRETGITIDSANYITISNLVVRGDGPTNNSGYGILCDNRLDAFQRLQNLRIESVEVSGFGIFGILISGKEAGYHHVRVTDCDLHHNLRGGMEIAGRLPWDSHRYAHSDVVVRRCRAHDNSGDPNYNKNHSGSGMVLYQVDGGMIEDCQAWANGQLCHHGNGGVGIWTCASRGVVIQRCESFANRTSGGDGGGFDLDGGSIECVLQCNYSHDNDGPGLMVYTYPYASHADRDCVVRFNVSDNDSRRSRTYAGLWVRSDGNGITGLQVYNNTVRLGAWSNQAAFVSGQGVEANFRNNIFVGDGGACPLLVEQPQAKLRFENNVYWAGGSPLKITWGARTFTALGDWRKATGQETSGDKATGIFVDPRFSASSDNNPKLPGDWQTRLAAYRPKVEVISAGIDQGLLPSITAAETQFDILGQPLSAGHWPFGALMPAPR